MASRRVRTSTVGRALETSVLVPTYVLPVVAATQSLPAQTVHRSNPATPVNVDRLTSFLRFHPDKSFSSYIIDSMRFGFDIDFSVSASAWYIHPITHLPLKIVHLLLIILLLSVPVAKLRASFLLPLFVSCIFRACK